MNGEKTLFNSLQTVSKNRAGPCPSGAYSLVGEIDIKQLLKKPEKFNCESIGAGACLAHQSRAILFALIIAFLSYHLVY